MEIYIQDFKDAHFLISLEKHLCENQNIIVFNLNVFCISNFVFMNKCIYKNVILSQLHK